MIESPTIDFSGWAVVIGMATPLVVSFIKSPNWPRWLKIILSVVVSAITGLVNAGINLGWSNLDFNVVMANFGLIWTLGQSTYLGLLNGTQFDHRLASLVEFPVEPGDPSGGPGGGD